MTRMVSLFARGLCTAVLLAICPTIDDSAYALPSIGDVVEGFGNAVEQGTDAAAGAASALPPAAHRTIRGKIEYWDVYSETYKPAKNVLVEITGYALDLLPLPNHSSSITTDTDGKYEKNFPVPLIDVQSVTFRVRVSAATPDHPSNPFSDCLVRVSAPVEATGYGPALFPYRVETKHSTPVFAGSPETINVKVGGNKDSGAAPGYSGYEKSCYANAFRVHQEILEYYKKLGEWGFPYTALTDTEVVIPANMDNHFINELDIDNSQYNPNFGFIEIALHDYDGTWTQLNTTTMDEDATSCPELMDTCRHEASHAVHSKMGPQPLNCIDSVANHSMNTQSNVITGYTEGLAEFLPLATLGIGGGRLECPPSDAALAGYGCPAQLSIPATSPIITDHATWEGDVAAMFWDLFDPSGQEEYCRQITNTAINDATAVPDSVRRTMKWTDRMSDSNLSRFRSVLASPINGIWPVSSVDQFLDKYKALPGVDLRALKAIAFNRCIGVPGTSESAAAIDGQIVCKRQSPRFVKLEFTVAENESEDRPYVSWQLLKENPDGRTVSLLTSSANGSWNGNKWATGTLIRLPEPSGEEYYWLVVSDEMLPVAYRLRNPAFGSDLRLKAGRIAAEALRAQAPASLRMIAQSQSGLSGSSAQIENVRAARAAYKAVRSEMQAYVWRQEAALEQQRALFYLAKFAGGLELPDKVPPELMQITITGSGVETKGQSAAAKAYRQWLSDTAAGKLPPRRLKSNAKAFLVSYATEAARLIEEQKSAKVRVDQLSRQLADASAKLDLGQQKSYLKASSTFQVDYSEELLNLLAKDNQLQPAMESNLAALRTLAAVK